MNSQNKPNLIKRGSISLNNSFENKHTDIKIIAAEFPTTIIINFGNFTSLRGGGSLLDNSARFHTTSVVNSYIHFFI